MIELLGGGLLGGIFGGVFRLFPEVLKFFDKKNEREHELAMFNRQCELESIRGQQKLAEIGAQRDAAVDEGVMQAFKAAIDQQTEMVKTAGKGWIASLSASVRPVVTYWVLLIWTFVHCYTAYVGYSTGLNAIDTFKLFMTADFTALVSGTVNYWFLDRTLAKRGLS